MPIYKILRPDEWAAFEADGGFAGSALDLTDGFVHCSSREQVAATALRYFGEDGPLVVLELDDEALGDAVRWEPSVDGARFPHVYRGLTRGDVLAVHHAPDAAAVPGAISPR